MFWKKMAYWFPRLLSVLITLFFPSFTLEAFSPGFSWQDGVAHLLVGLLTAAISYWAWKKPHDGGLFFMLIGIIFLIFIHEDLNTSLVFGVIPFITGLLFYLSAKTKN